MKFYREQPADGVSINHIKVATEATGSVHSWIANDLQAVCALSCC